MSTHSRRTTRTGTRPRQAIAAAPDEAADKLVPISRLSDAKRKAFLLSSACTSAPADYVLQAQLKSSNKHFPATPWITGPFSARDDAIDLTLQLIANPKASSHLFCGDEQQKARQWWSNVVSNTNEEHRQACWKALGNPKDLLARLDDLPMPSPEAMRLVPDADKMQVIIRSARQLHAEMEARSACAESLAAQCCQDHVLVRGIRPGEHAMSDLLALATCVNDERIGGHLGAARRCASASVKPLISLVVSSGSQYQGDTKSWRAMRDNDSSDPVLRTAAALRLYTDGSATEKDVDALESIATPEIVRALSTHKSVQHLVFNAMYMHDRLDTEHNDESRRFQRLPLSLVVAACPAVVSTSASDPNSSYDYGHEDRVRAWVNRAAQLATDASNPEHIALRKRIVEHADAINACVPNGERRWTKHGCAYAHGCIHAWRKDMAANVTGADILAARRVGLMAGVTNDIQVHHRVRQDDVMDISRPDVDVINDRDVLALAAKLGHSGAQKVAKTQEEADRARHQLHMDAFFRDEPLLRAFMETGTDRFPPMLRMTNAGHHTQHKSVPPMEQVMDAISVMAHELLHGTHDVMESSPADMATHLATAMRRMADRMDAAAQRLRSEASATEKPYAQPPG